MHAWDYIGWLEILITIAWVAGWLTWIAANFLCIYLTWRK